MRTLYNIILEALQGGGTVDGKFIYKEETLENLIKNAPHLNISNLKPTDISVVNEYFDKLLDNWKKSNSNFHGFIYSSKERYFKIDYIFYQNIYDLKNQYPDFEIIEKGGKKVHVKYHNKKLFETGKGSMKKIPTELQETSTVNLFNQYVSVMKDDDGSIINDHEYILNIVGDRFNDSQEWINSFSKQTRILIKYLEKLGLDPQEYNLTRWGDNNNEVGKEYTKTVKSYIDQFKNDEAKQLSKDIYDPTDVILYKYKEKDKIVRWLKAHKDSENCNNDFLNELFNPGICMGISLKQITSDNAGAIEFNVNKNNIIKSCNYNSEFIKTNGKSRLQIVVPGDYNFTDFINLEKKEVEQTKSITLTMRTFGGGRVGIDVCTSPKDPSLGKCPVGVWKNIIGADKNDGIEKCIEKFINMLNDKENVNSDLKKIIQAAIKEGTACFPFVLLHNA